MHTVKNMVATVKEKAGNASAEVEEKKEDIKFAAEEKVEKMKAHGDEDKEVEAMQRRDERAVVAERHKDQKEAQNAANKDRAVNPHPDPIGERPSPADLGMGEENPSTPNMGGGGSTLPGSTIPNYVGPVGGTTNRLNRLSL